MLITSNKTKEELLKLAQDSALLIVCEGCRQAHLPVEAIKEFREELKKNNVDFYEITSDYLCNQEYDEFRTGKWAESINKYRNIMIFSCGVGVQTISSYIKKPVISALDTVYVKGFRGVTPTEYDCEQCGDCKLNYTGGICPYTACSKGLLNGSCGGAKNGKCEVSQDMDCGWERIYRRLEKKKKLELINIYQEPRKYSLLFKK